MTDAADRSAADGPPATPPGLLLTTPGGGRFHFDPGALCLELLTTGGPGPYTRYEVLHRPADLAAWLPPSRLRLPADAVRISPAQLAAARTLRDALWRLAAARAHGGRGTPADHAVLNRAAEHPPLVPRIAPDGTAAAPLPADGAQLVSTLARDAIALLTGPYADRVRECGADNCQLIFVDTSRPGRRRWCSMERCGNRHKVRALRARRDSEEAPPTTAPTPDSGRTQADRPSESMG
ncbi:MULTISPECIES: CGNR zinc finger domain-containing protein [Streptomycetaceae]|uniref:CGNR zinc finger domain-containing protein n=1 Tax=Streptomycetaceae TaxID=2062 RepID=UPI00093E746D|nr:CGNR zinc finger domain-containing protein [Streptomyces sp. CB02056]OKI08648.1 zf-CGNR multi-domain protein [Streptomyces sp. CB02056]